VSEIDEGVIDKDTDGTKETTALTDFVGSARLFAVTVTLWALGMDAGAVYRPVLEMDPTGELDHDTPVFVFPVTAALN